MSTSSSLLTDRRLSQPCDGKSLRYIIKLADRHDVDAHRLLRSFLETERNGTVTCGSLSITIRKRARDYAVFLVARGKKILVQMRVKGNMWANPSMTKSLFSVLVDRARSSRKWWH